MSIPIRLDLEESCVATLTLVLRELQQAKTDDELFSALTRAHHVWAVLLEFMPWSRIGFPDPTGRPFVSGLRGGLVHRRDECDLGDLINVSHQLVMHCARGHHPERITRRAELAWHESETGRWQSFEAWLLRMVVQKASHLPVRMDSMTKPALAVGYQAAWA